MTLLPHHHHRCCHTAASAPPLFVQDLESVQLHDYFSRFQFSVKTKRFHPEQVTVFCSCMQPENPDRPMSQVGRRPGGCLGGRAGARAGRVWM